MPEQATITKYEWATKYQALQLAIIPLCPPTHAGVSDMHKQNCNAPGKAPIMRDWTSRGTPTKKEVRDWFEENPDYNLGLVLGNTGFYNLVGIDIDGVVGEELLEDQARGVLPPTWEFVTGNGRRLLYSLPEGAESKKKALKGENGELAFLAQGQQTVLPPSMHIRGVRYTWTNSPDDVELAEAPQWLLNIVLVQSDSIAPSKNPVPTVTADDWQTKVTEGNRNAHLVKLAGSLIARRNIPKPQVLSFLRTWNEENCDPPLPDQEITTMVENLHEAEHTKAKELQAKKGKGNPLRPHAFAEYFVKEQDKKGYAWRFCVDRGMFYACDKIRGPWRSVELIYLESEIRRELIKIDEGWDSMRSIREVNNALQGYLADPRNDKLFDIGQDPDLDHIYVKNGMLNWRTLELKPWDPATYNTIQLPVEWDADIQNAESFEFWDDVLTQWLPDEESRRFLQEYVGYCLIPDPSHRTAVFLFGVGSNGKSLFLDVISKLFDGYISFIPLHWVGERFESARLIDKLINVCGDIDNKYMSETSTIKSMISGDPIRAEYKFGKSFHFHPVCRLMFSANQLPRTSDHSEGWYSRWKFIEFPRRFKTNTTFKKNLMHRMSQPDALKALLLWAVEGLRRLYKIEEFTVSPSMMESEKLYRLENNSVQAFVDQNIMKTGHIGIVTMLVLPSLYQVYQIWCTDNGVKAVSQHEFTRRMGVLDFDKGTRTVRGASANVLLGIQFTDFGAEQGLEEEYLFNESVRVSTIKRRARKVEGSSK